MSPLRFFSRAVFLLGVTTSLFSAESTSIQVRISTRDALAAKDAGNLPLFLEKMETAAALRPDFPRILVNLADAQTANGRPEQAVATLGRLAALGVHSPVDKSAAFTSLRDREDFKAVVKRLSKNLEEVGAGEIAFTLPGMTGLIEGVTWRAKTKQFFFSDVFHRCVWVREPDGKIRRFTQDNDTVFGLFGLAIDEERGALWVATSAVPAMNNYTSDLKHAAGLAEFDLETGELRSVKRLGPDARPHMLGDLAVAPDGTVFASDSAAPVLWKLAPGAPAPSLFLEHEDFVSLQGLAFNTEGTVLYLADYSSGLLAIDVSSRQVTNLTAPADTTLVGIDGLARAANGDLFATQSGVRPMRVLQIALEEGGRAVKRVEVLESGNLSMASVALGCVTDDGFFFIGNSGWSRFEGDDPKATPPRAIPVFRTKPTAPLPGKKAPAR